MPQLTGEQLVGDTFQADQATGGAGGPNSDGSYEYEATTKLSQYGGEGLVTAGSGEDVTVKIVGGSHDGETYDGTIVANDAADFLLETTLGFVYVTNDPAAQPTPPADPNGPPDPDSIRTVGALGPDNTYTYQPVCFASGTSILTDRGAVAVESLRVGDLVVTASGERRPIRWLGHRTIDCGRSRVKADVLPVRIAAHALGPNRPMRDLVVSPGHAICVDVGGEILTPASALVDDVTITRIAVATITYWHVEIDEHDVILAENLPVESYLDTGNRSFFVDGTVVTLDGRPEPPVATHVACCRPYHAEGPRVAAARARIHARVARRPCGKPALQA